MNLDVVDDNGEHLLECLMFTFIACIQDVLRWTLLPFKATGETHMVVCVCVCVCVCVRACVRACVRVCVVSLDMYLL